MAKVVRLKYGSIDLQNFPDGRIALNAQFYDNEMNRYVWTPAWVQIEQLFLKAVNTEQLNKPRGPWVKQFADTARQVFQEWSSDIQEAELLDGVLIAYQEQKLVIQYEALVDLSHAYAPFDGLFGTRTAQKLEKQVLHKSIPTGFPVTRDFLRNWLKRKVRCLVINGVVIEIEVSEPVFPFEAGIYPPPTPEN
jgi:hypothetical protein